MQAETVEDVDDWKEALERALEAAPNAALVVGHETAFRNDSHDAFEGFADHGESQIPKLLLCLLRQIFFFVGVSATRFWGGPGAKLVMWV